MGDVPSLPDFFEKLLKMKQKKFGIGRSKVYLFL